MKYNSLGRTGIKVSELCFGALPMGPLQGRMILEQGAKLIRSALDNGVNFIDTAQMYKTYDYIALALKDYDGDVVISSKSTAEDYRGMEQAVQEALTSLNRDCIDIFNLHAARGTVDVFSEREGALRCILDYKQKGYIKAVAISTHSVLVTEKAAEIEEIDVVFSIINKVGRGIREGTKEEMIKAINHCHQAGKGVFAMKALAGGNLADDLVASIKYVREIKGIDAVAIGMVNPRELELNLKIFNDEPIDEHLLLQAVQVKKLIILERFCTKCGACIEACPNNALLMGENSVKIDHEQCLLCGYCYPVCPEFIIRLV